MITRRYLKNILHYNPRTGRWTWLKAIGTRIKIGQRAGCFDVAGGYRLIRIKGKRYNESTLAMFYMTGHWPKVIVDHKNNIRHENHWSNLRPANWVQNRINSKDQPNSTGFRGVSKHGAVRFRAQIKIGKVRYQLGPFKTAKQAHAAYCKAAKKHFGEFVRV